MLPFSDALELTFPPGGGTGRLVPLLRALAGLEARGGTDVAAALERLEALGLRRGLTVVVSDFFDPRGIDAVTAALARVRHRLLLVQLTRATDRVPDLAGEARLVDCESAAVTDVAITPAVLERYTQAYDRFQTELSDFARRRGIGLLQLDVDAPVVPQLSRVFAGGRLLV